MEFKINLNDSQCIQINSYTLKIEVVNIRAMIEGFITDNNKHSKVTIYTAHQRSKSLQNDFRETPKLITKHTYKRPTYPLSQIGENLYDKNYTFSNQYIAVLDRIFYIENDINLWRILCNNGIFNIWKPEAPFNSYFVNKNPENRQNEDPMILLIRIFEIDNNFTNKIIKGYYFDRIEKKEDRNVKIIKPIIENEGYTNYILKIKGSIKNYILREEKIKNTCNLSN